MLQRITQIAILVRDYDEAIHFYTQSLGFKLLEDTDRGQGKRWVRVAPSGPLPGSAGVELLLARAAAPDQQAHIGNQTGGRVFLFIQTDNFHRDYTAMQSKGVTFLEPPREEPYGTVAVFTDLYGNKFDLIQPRNPS